MPSMEKDGGRGEKVVGNEGGNTRLNRGGKRRRTGVGIVGKGWEKNGREDLETKIRLKLVRERKGVLDEGGNNKNKISPFGSRPNKEGSREYQKKRGKSEERDRRS